MDNLLRNPLKLYIQDIYRAKQTDNKYVYELFGLRFKNIMIHGVVTSVYNITKTSANLEVSDPTGTVHIYYDKKKSNTAVSDSTLRDLKNNYIDASKFGDLNIQIMTKMMQGITDKNTVIFEDGDYISVVGDIFVESLKNIRMVSAYNCDRTNVEYDIVWMEELRYMYDKYY
ncbi:uncharacterized protein LOC106138419, partial [Amyelois transitella]|uniref:uncharacterized protein LOC106138419 n=1 Tax=Amyelois transitella TaxID=680683 RepID=UPI0029906A56